MNVLITGCASGFGRSLVNQLLKDGWTVLATMRRCSERASLFTEEKKTYGDRLHLLELDVTNDGDRRRVAGVIEETFGGRLDALINNAGYGLFGALEDISDAQIRHQFEVNFFGLILLTQALLPFLKVSGNGRIVNLSSVFGFTGFPLTGAYCASKFAVEGFTESLRVELSTFGIQATLVEPGTHRTRFGDLIQWGDRSFSEDSHYVSASRAYEKLKNRMNERKGLRTPEAVARAISKVLKRRRMPMHLVQGMDAWSSSFFRRSLFTVLWDFAILKFYRFVFTPEKLPLSRSPEA